MASNTVAEVDTALAQAKEAYTAWRNVPAPRRGELVRLLGNRLREQKQALGSIITLETGKILQEGLGEVQEMIDICDFAVGLSRQLYGLTIASERPGHRMAETWHPLGACVVISAFNFPAAVWSWNAALALVCGNAVIWKPSEKTPLTALAVNRFCSDALKEFGDAPAGLTRVDQRRPRCRREAGGRSAFAIDRERDGQHGNGPRGRRRSGASRFGRSLLELGGNNAGIVYANRRSWNWRCAASCSLQSARPVSAARRCAVCSFTKACTTRPSNV